MALRILVVEDDKHTRRILESLLARDPALAARGVEVTVAEDGKAALELLDQLTPELVITDLLMPRMDGFTFCRELRKHPKCLSVPLIVTSAIYKDQATLHRLHHETGAEFFAKPFQMRELMATVRRLLGETAPAQAASTTGSAPALSATGSAPSVPSSAVAAARPVARRPEGGLPAAGQLIMRGPPRLLLEIAEQKLTGTLTLERGKVRKLILLQHGTPVAVTSNLRTETLGHFLVARGVLDEAQHRQALERAQQSHDRLGQVLVELGLISEEVLLQQLGAQMRAKVTNLLRWKEGAWAFAAGPPAAALLTPVEAARLVFSGLAKTAHIDEIAQDLIHVRGRIGLTLRAERHHEAFTRQFGSAGLELLQQRPLLEDVMAGTDPSAMLVQLDTLLVCGMAELEPGARPHPNASERGDPASLERIVVAEAPAPPRRPTRNLYDELFSDEPSEVKPLPSAHETPREPDDDDDESGVMQLPVGPIAAELATEVEAVTTIRLDPQVETLRKEILSTYLAIHGKSHYQVLGLQPDAAPEDIAAAYGELGRRFRLERFAGVDLGRDYAHLEEIHQILRQAFETLTARAEREQYDAELSARTPPSRASLGADLLAQEAQSLLQHGDADGAQHKLAQAVAAAPDQADYHALYAWALFVAGGGTQKNVALPVLREVAQAAWREIEQALAIDPDSVDAHDFAGRIAYTAGNDEDAVHHLEHVLDADPTRADALLALEGAHTRRGDWKRLERQYRKLIHRLGDKHDPERALRLWWRLAELYRLRLGDRASAKIAYEICAKLAPEDPRPRDALARLHAEEPGEWQKAAQALRESARLQPGDVDPVRALFQLHVDGERWDAALAAAAVMAVRGLAEVPALDYVRRFRTRFLQRAGASIAPELYERIRHPDDDPDLCRLFALVFAAHPPAFSLAELGTGDDDRVDFAILPEAFQKVFAYLIELMRVEAPAVYRRADFGLDVHVGALTPPVLLAGPQALAMSDRIGLAFRLGRALTFLAPPRAVASALPTRALKAYLLGAVTLVTPGMRIEDGEGQVAQVRTQLAAQPALARELAPIVERLLHTAGGSINLSRFARGLARTADRIGLVVCNELQAAARITAESGVTGAVDDLLDFALSQEYQSTKDALGLSIAV